MFNPVKLNVIEQFREVISAFGGVNRQPIAEDGEFSAMTNLTSDHFPVMSVRDKRHDYIALMNPQGILSKESLAWIDGASLYYNGDLVEGITLSESADMLPKQMVSMGARLCVFPDAVYVNTEKLSDCGSLNASYIAPSATAVTYTMTTFSGAAIDPIVSASAPEDAANGAYWLDVSGENHALKQYSASAGMWTTVATVYVKISCPGIGAAFGDGDGVRIYGAKYNDPSNIDLTKQIESLNGSHIIKAKTDDSITVVGILDQTYTQTDTSEFRVERKVPDMDYVTECQNRLWGCKYGVVDGETVNELYCCKLGDPKNWEVYNGIANDSWRASVGTDGAWTGAVTYGNTPIFFKDDAMHKIYPSAEGAHQIVSASVRGASRGSWRSFSIVDEVLYYLSRDCVCAYDGSLPVSVSEKLGRLDCLNGVGGSWRGKYYLSCTDKNKKPHTYVYDPVKKMWHEESPHNAIAYAEHEGNLWYLDGTNNHLMSTDGNGGKAEGAVEWRAESGIQGFAYPDNKYLSRYDFRMDLAPGATFNLAIEYDSNGKPIHYGTVRGNGKVRTYVVPVIPRRCDHLKLIMYGKGECKLYSIARILEVGSDGNVY